MITLFHHLSVLFVYHFCAFSSRALARLYVCVVCLPFLCIFIHSPRQGIRLCCLFTVFVHFRPEPAPGYMSVLFVYRFCAFSSRARARVYNCVVYLPFLCIFVQSPRQDIRLCGLFTVFVHFRPEPAPGYMSVLFVYRFCAFSSRDRARLYVCVVCFYIYLFIVLLSSY